MKGLVLGIMTAMMGQASYAVASVDFDQQYFIPIAYAGSGCPQGSVLILPSDKDPSALRMTFDDFIVVAGGETGKTIERKNCTLAFPIQVPEGYAVAIGSTMISGENDLPNNSVANLTINSFFAGNDGSSASKRFLGPQDRNYNLNINATNGLVWSACGADVTLRMNISVFVRNSNVREEAIAQVNEIPKLFRLQWKRCH